MRPTHGPPPKQATRDKQIHVKLDMDLLDPESMRDKVSFEGAIGLLESHLVNPAIDTQKLLQDILAVPRLLELFISSMSAESYNVLLAWLEDIFPSTAAEFDLSFPSTLLQELSFFCGSLQDPALDHCQRTMKLARPVLSALATICSLEDIKEEAEPPQGARRQKRISQKQAKKVKRAERRPSIDAGPFLKLGVSVPANKGDALTLSQEVLRSQKAALMAYLEVLRKPELMKHIHDCYIPTIAPPEEPAIPTETQSSMDIETTFATIKAEPDLLSAYPTMQLLRAALDLDFPNDFGLWKLFTSHAPRRTCATHGRRIPNCSISSLKSWELSHGHFSANNQKCLVGSGSGIPIFEAKMTGDTRLVYRVDCEYGSDAVRQVLRIYGIYTHAQMHGRRFWDAVSRSGRGSKEHRKRCVYRNTPRTPGSNVTPPATWPPLEDNEDEKGELQLPDFNVEDEHELNDLLCSEKFVPFSQAFLNGTFSDKEVHRPFHMSVQEQAITEHPGSCFVLGRSGTGKTTTIVFKMINMERAWCNLKEDLAEATPQLRQLFLTQSRVLAEKVEEFFKKMMPREEVEGQAMPPSPQIDIRSSGGVDFEMVDKDEEDRHRSLLPQKFSDLTDDDFPLFLTSDQLYRLLAADFNELVDAQERAKRERPSREHLELPAQGDLHRVPNHAISYWWKFQQGLTKGLGAAVVRVIEGSERAMNSVGDVLDRQSYCDTSERGAAFSGRREDVYSLFEAYLKEKRKDGQADSADRTHAIIHNLLQYGIPGQKVDFVYIDEVQDNLLVYTFILRLICRCPDGVFWAGDTAQTISAGSSFRFNELKAFMYRLEKGSKASNYRTFQLTKNYRSHGDIFKCANTVVRLITKFWPYTIDFLEEDKSTIDGLKPTFFGGGSGEAPEFGEFLSDEGGCTIEFGARQCQRPRPCRSRPVALRIGDVGIILTLNESKGLEFEDVVLYNFFADSTVGASQWRLVLAELSDSEGLTVKSPVFDEIKHHGLCRESSLAQLKSLYVAITRARLNLWIVDYSDQGEPMRILWQHKGQISTWHELPSVERDQLTMFEVIVSDHQQNLLILGRKFSQLHPASTIRCLDHVFSAEAISSGFKSDDPAKIWSMLEAFSVYTRALRSMAYSHQSCDNPDLQRLLSFSVTVQGEQYQVHPGTLLAQELVWKPWFGKLNTTLDPAVDNFVVGKWLYEAFFDHSPDPTIGFVPDGFLTGLLRYMMLHRIAMRTDSPPYAHRIPCIAGPLPAWLHRQADGVHITYDLLSFFNGHRRGVPICTRLLKHILWWRLPVDVAILCDFLDTVSSALVVIYRARTSFGVHNVVLPCKWLLSVAGLFLDEFLSQKEVGLVSDYVRTMEILLRLYTRNEIGHLFPTSNPVSLTRNIYIARICQNLAIVGCNIQNPDIKAEIYRILRSLGTSNEMISPHWLYEKLVAAVQWEEIIDVVRNNSFELAIDDMIQLADRSRVANIPLPAGNLRRVVYDRPANIPSLLASDVTGPSWPNPVGFRAAVQPAPITVALGAGSETALPAATIGSTILPAPAEETPAVTSLDGENGGRATEGPDEAPAQFASYAEKELVIVRKAALVYLERTRRRLRMSAFGPPSALGLLRVRHFNEFLAQLAQMPWSGPLHTFYRKLYLGPVPHIMVALDCVLEYLHGRKRKETMRLGDKGGDHLELDAIQAEVKRWDELCRTAMPFKNSLGPQSEIHREADRQQLEQLVSDVQSFIFTIPGDSDKSWKDDLGIAVKGILMRKKAVAPTQQRKSELRVEDDLNYVYMRN
ncbi:uncharacterized protein PHACADRAFT_189549 [Phanerochaete carnosa HHB-10118-sp]|uniref:UvrD-like helicase ATP-binding domain-containing protein n=1 Tax=Phanerochaete carnosa (strain HHB-10118-sp) TaxID=650164 RepID=K5W911_PHACS|nr:uncharacterized protein PHACADRAFT_189549 [Phanerochaete carnosa HHB-10118-sp]EKM60418.1 hypothetical protein PHACADRAFT_189549 [Phanerochaete carnosa HHB-10118-sp]